MSKSVFVTKAVDNSFVLISYRNVKTNKLIGQIMINHDGKRYYADVDLWKGKQNYGFKLISEEINETYYELCNFAAKNNLPYLDMKTLAIWQTRDAAWARFAEKVGA